MIRKTLIDNLTKMLESGEATWDDKNGVICTGGQRIPVGRMLVAVPQQGSPSLWKCVGAENEYFTRDEADYLYNLGESVNKYRREEAHLKTKRSRLALLEQLSKEQQ